MSTFKMDLSAIVSIQDLPHGIEPAFLFRHFQGTQYKTEIEEIFGWEGGSPIDYIVFRTVATAQAFVHTKNAQKENFGVHGQTRKLRAAFVHSEVDLGDRIRLSNFLKDRDNEAQVRTKTIEITNLPHNSIEANVNEILDPFMQNYIEDGDGSSQDESAEIEWKTLNRGTALVRFETASFARAAVDGWNGTYWKNATIYIKCVPDEEFSDIVAEREAIAAERQLSGGKDVMLQVRNIKYDANVDYIRRVFHPYKLKDVNIPAGNKGFAYTFMTPQECTAFFMRYPNGMRWHFEGRSIKVKVDGKSKSKSKFVMPITSSAIASAPNMATKNVNGLAMATSSMSIGPRTTAAAAPIPVHLRFANDVRVDNLHSSTTKLDVQELFKGFKPALTPTKVIMKGTFAWVKFESREEAQRSVPRVNGKKIRGRPVRLSMAQK